ncbi:MAG: hypothetical protein ACYTFG_13155, partial [Planctomycetota bacterium]
MKKRIPIIDIVTGDFGFFDCSKNRFVFNAQPVSLGDWIRFGSPVIVVHNKNTIEESSRNRNLIRCRVVDYMLGIVKVPTEPDDDRFGAMMDFEERKSIAIQIIKSKSDLIGPLD